MIYFFKLRIRIFPLVVFLLFLSTHFTIAQSITGQLPLSRYGIGHSFGYGLSRNESMGSCGLVTPSQDHVNLLNPALLPFTEKVNFEIDLRYINRNLKVGDSYSYSGAGGGPAQISVSLPVHKKVTVAFGIRPFTNRDFIFYQKRFIGADTINYKSHGSGGTSQVFVTTGVHINSHLSVGLEAGYVFGTLEDSLSFGAIPQANNFTFIQLTKRRIGQFTFKPGVHFRYPLKGKENTYIAFGATADLNSKFNYRNYQTFIVQGTGAVAETLDNGTKSSIRNPTKYGFGIGYYRSLVWSLNLEADYINVASIKSSEASLVYKNAFGIRLGGEISPGIKKSTNYFNIITFRAGLNYNQLPFTVDGKSVTDQSVSLGASFPIIRKEAKYTRPLINLAVVYGQRGNQQTTIGLEKYWQITMGFTMNDFLWFNRYRID